MFLNTHFFYVYATETIQRCQIYGCVGIISPMSRSHFITRIKFKRLILLRSFVHVWLKFSRGSYTFLREFCDIFTNFRHFIDRIFSLFLDHFRAQNDEKKNANITSSLCGSRPSVFSFCCCFGFAEVVSLDANSDRSDGDIGERVFSRYCTDYERKRRLGFRLWFFFGICRVAILKREETGRLFGILSRRAIFNALLTNCAFSTRIPLNLGLIVTKKSNISLRLPVKTIKFYL